MTFCHSDLIHLLCVCMRVLNVEFCVRRIGDFFQSMKMLKDRYSARYTMSDAVLQHLLHVERKFLIACPLFKKLET